MDIRDTAKLLQSEQRVNQRRVHVAFVHGKLRFMSIDEILHRITSFLVGLWVVGGGSNLRYRVFAGWSLSIGVRVDRSGVNDAVLFSEGKLEHVSYKIKLSS